MIVHCKRALEIGRSKALNCVTEELYDGAIQAAEEADERGGASASPLLLQGVPVSIKDNINIQGSALRAASNS
jgi:Asp-tRNA(Asn)/Glu-tRNA(Gln) amidotransferase A subunit family amidase